MGLFKCSGCEALKAENERLHKLVERLMDRVAGPVDTEEAEPERSASFRVREETGDNGEKIIVEEHTYGGE